MEKIVTHISFELFNYCNGSCTGCMLSSLERKYELETSLSDIEKALTKVAKYGEKYNLLYLPVFSFGDTFKLKEETLFGVYDICTNKLGMPFGTTVTCVDKDFTEQYLKIAKRIYNEFPKTIIDITIDPFRLKSPSQRDNYITNLKNVMDNSRKMHLQVLLSQAVLNKFTPKELYETLLVLGDKHNFFLSFSPTKENLGDNRFKYDVIDAYKYVTDFYALNPKNKQFNESEKNRFKADGKYSHFAQRVFHISHDFNVYPVNYSIFGDVIMDERNKLNSFGNILTNELEDIITPAKLKKLDVLNGIEMERSNFDCTNCKWLDSCTYSGIGLIRHIYKGYENRIGHCYGPGFEK